MIKKQDKRLKIGVLGCGPIAQFAHFESAVKGCNTDLYAICDVAADLVQRMGDTYLPAKRFHQIVVASGFVGFFIVSQWHVRVRCIV